MIGCLTGRDTDADILVTLSDTANCGCSGMIEQAWATPVKQIKV